MDSVGWDYKLVSEQARERTDLEAELNRLGTEGWEIVGAVGYERLDSVVLKREKRDTPDEDEEPGRIY